MAIETQVCSQIKVMRVGWEISEWGKVRRFEDGLRGRLPGSPLSGTRRSKLKLSSKVPELQGKARTAPGSYPSPGVGGGAVI